MIIRVNERLAKKANLLKSILRLKTKTEIYNLVFKAGLEHYFEYNKGE
jgi:hypothetical protein